MLTLSPIVPAAILHGTGILGLSLGLTTSGIISSLIRSNCHTAEVLVLFDFLYLIFFVCCAFIMMILDCI